jgi:hypothetical protein
MNDENQQNAADELSEQSLQGVNGGAFDAYLTIEGIPEPPPPPPHHP